MVEENYVVYQLMSIFLINTETLSTNATFSLFLKKNASTRSLYESILTVHTNTLYRFKNATKSDYACALRARERRAIIRQKEEAWFLVYNFALQM